MKFRKTIDISFRVQVPGFKATRKYRVASAVCVISDQCAFWDDYGIAIAIEPSGKAHIITYGAKLTKRQIQEEYGRGGKFICVGLRSLNGRKEEPIYEMIVGK